MDQTIKGTFLKSIFWLKRNFAKGAAPSDRRFDGVEITAFRGGARASGTISADFEIAWAFRGRSEEERLQRAIRCRHNVPYLVRILEETGIPITWATVGHLFLERCERGPSGLAHPEMPRPPRNLRWEGDWYRHDPCTDSKKDPHWYAPDLIQLIRASKVRHEIGSHSFSHIDFSGRTSTPELVRCELEACLKVMVPQGLHLRSLVYPFGDMGHHYLDLLGQMGLTAVRHRDQRVTLGYPERTPSGVYKLYESMNMRRARHYDYIEKARIFLEEAVRRRAAYHIWFHPSDPTEVFEREFYGIVQHMAKLQREGRLWVATMAELAAYCEAREQTELDVQREANSVTIVLRSKYDMQRYGKTVLTLRITAPCVPRECHLQYAERCKPVGWTTENPKGNDKCSRSFLVDVPVEASELRVGF